mmetsp:Transcript_29525/g.55339  ORF Transcript_29525/g.55339 Transcript_29525/m.55339 type:complete len:103 (-) Transcript_29525:105-413(-)
MVYRIQKDGPFAAGSWTMEDTLGSIWNSLCLSLHFTSIPNSTRTGCDPKNGLVSPILEGYTAMLSTYCNWGGICIRAVALGIPVCTWSHTRKYPRWSANMET